MYNFFNSHLHHFSFIYLITRWMFPYYTSFIAHKWSIRWFECFVFLAINYFYLYSLSFSTFSSFNSRLYLYRLSFSFRSAISSFDWFSMSACDLWTVAFRMFLSSSISFFVLPISLERPPIYSLSLRFCARRLSLSYAYFYNFSESSSILCSPLWS